VERTRCCLWLLAVSLVLCYSVTAEEKADMNQVPEWVAAGKPIRQSDIPETDYAYLAKWLDENAKPAEDYFVDLFNRHQVVIFGESHNIKEHKDFIIELIPRLYREARVRCIGWEFSRHTDNAELERLVTSPEFDRKAALEFARDQNAHAWNSKEHWDIIEAVWRLNNGLEAGRDKMRLIGLDANIDMAKFFTVSKTMPPDSPESQEEAAKVRVRDRVMAEQVEKEIVEKGEKGLVFVGRCHDFTHYAFPSNVDLRSGIMGHLLHQKYGDRIFQVWPHVSALRVMEDVMELRGHKTIGFDLYSSPFAEALCPADFTGAPDVPFSRIARGFVYLGPRDDLHRNTTIEGFVTDEMFKKYKRYYEVDFERTFKDAEDVDKFLQEHLWPDPQKHKRRR